MEPYKAIPRGYMTVGVLAKKMGVTVRALQYYDRIGLLSPSAESEGGRRLYTDKDMIKLHQILSLKSVGFSLEDIKNRLIALDSPAEVANVLAEQAAAIRNQLETLTKSLDAIEALRAEVLQMQAVNFQKYADILVNLQMKNEFYWLIKYFDDETLDHIRNHFDHQSGLDMIGTFTRLRDEAIRLQQDGVPPESERGLAFAKAFWEMILEFTGGDMSLLPKLMEIGTFEGMGHGWTQQQLIANVFIEPALSAYFDKQGINPLEEEPK